MFLVLIKDYGFELVGFGEAPDRQRSGVFNTRSTSGEHRKFTITRFKEAREISDRPEFFEVLDLKLVGYVKGLPRWMLSYDAIPTLPSMVTLVLHYMKHRPEGSFVDWVRLNPALEQHNRCRTNLGIFFTDKYEVILLYTIAGRLEYEKISVSSWIHDGHVTTLDDSIDNAFKAIDQQRAALAAQIAKIKSNPFDVVEQIARTDLSSFVNRG